MAWLKQLKATSGAPPTRRACPRPICAESIIGSPTSGFLGVIFESESGFTFSQPHLASQNHNHSWFPGSRRRASVRIGHPPDRTGDRRDRRLHAGAKQFRISRVECNGLAEVAEGSVQLPLTEQCFRTVRHQFRVVRIEAQRRVQVGNRAIVLPEFGVGFGSAGKGQPKQRVDLKKAEVKSAIASAYAPPP